MKKIYSFISALSLLLISVVAQSQSLCTGFDDCVIDTTNNTTITATRDHAFNAFGNGNPGCLSDWEVASGTPSVWRNADGISNGFGTAYDGNQYALLGVCGDFYPTQYSDAIVAKYNFAPGNTYTVTMAIRTLDSSAFIDIDYVLLHNSINYTYNSNVGCSPTPAIPGTGLTVHTVTHFATANWTVVSFTVSNLSSNYDRLWIRPLVDQNVTTHLCIDAFCIHRVIEESTCTGFDNCVIDTTNNTTITATRDHAFNAFGNGNPGCLSDWEVASGTPSVWRNADGISNGFGTAYDGDQYALLGICGDFYPTQYSDAIVLKYNFTPGIIYTVSMAMRTLDSSAFADIGFVLLQNSLNYTYNSNVGCSPTPAIPGTGLSVHTITHFATAHWTLVSFTISNLSASYNRLWIRGLIDQNVTTHLCIDSFCISEPQIVQGIIPVTENTVLLENVPNPFSGSTIINYYLPAQTEQVVLAITDITGRKLREYPVLKTGNGKIEVDMSDLSNGVYVYSLISEGRAIRTKKMLLAK